MCRREPLRAEAGGPLLREAAAALPLAGCTALQGLRDTGAVEPGQKVLIIGAAGGVGTFAVQIAKALGAEVTGVCSTAKLDLVRSLGADHVIDYTREDFTQRRAALRPDPRHRREPPRPRPAGARSPRTGRWRSSSGEGRFARNRSRRCARSCSSPLVRQRLRPFLTKETNEDLVALAELVEAGKVTPVIDRTYPLSDVPEAIAYLEEGHARGKVVITV